MNQPKRSSSENFPNSLILKILELHTQHTKKKTVFNLTDKQLDDAALSILERGLNFATTPRTIPIEEIITGVESAIRDLTAAEADNVRVKTCDILQKAKLPKPNTTKEERQALRALKEDSNTVILQADKGNATVLMKTEEYNMKIMQLLNDSPYEEIKTNPIRKVERKTSALIKESNSIPESTKYRLRPTSSWTPKFYGLPKIHKTGVPLRPIVSAINSPTHPLARYLTSCLQTLTENNFSNIKNSYHFIEILQGIRLQDNDILVSFDVTSLFTNIPIEETISIIRDKLKILNLPEEWADLTEHCLRNTFFQYKDRFYIQKDGAAMGSPLSPLVANIFMEAFETEALENATMKPTHWFRFVDDTFVIWPNGQEELDKFLTYLNSLHENIKFTMEKEKDGTLPFLDVLVIKKEDGSLGHTVYRKNTHTNRYLHAESHHHPAVKNGTQS